MKQLLQKRVLYLGFMAVVMSLFPMIIEAQQTLSAGKFLSQRYSKLTMRSGNSTKHHALATFHRQDIPFQILSIHNGASKDSQAVWVRVRDYEGKTGWIRRDQLRSRRTAMVNDPKGIAMYSTQDDARAQKHPLAMLPQHYVLRIESCDEMWCQVYFTNKQHENLKGFVLKEKLWGAVDI